MQGGKKKNQEEQERIMPIPIPIHKYARTRFANEDGEEPTVNSSRSHEGRV